MDKNKYNTLDFIVLLNEIESGSSGSTANVIRQLREYECDAYRAGLSGPTGELVASFISALDTRVAERNSEIQSMCAHHYQGFVEAANDLLGIQNVATRLQNSMQDLDENLGRTIQEYFASCQNLSNCKSTAEHIDQCIGAIQITLPILDQYLRVEQSISDGRYYHALRTLDDLEHSHLHNVRAYAFSELLTRRIPKLRSDIKQASLGEITDFLANIRIDSTRLGTIAMRETADAQGMDADLLFGFADGDNTSQSTADPKQCKDKQNHDLLSSDVSDLNAATLDKELKELNNLFLEKPEDDDLNFADRSPIQTDSNPTHLQTENLVDFGPVYRCLHIHTALKEQVEFERHYCAQRRKQCQLILSLSANQQANMRNYGEFFSSVCGFFIVDDYLRQTLPGSSTFYQTYLDELWNIAAERLVEFAKSNTSSCQSVADIIRFKDYTALFIQTMANLGFSITGLSEMIAYTQRRYHSLLVKQWTGKFQKILQDDRLTPIEIRNEEDMSKLAELYPPCATPDFLALPFPRHLSCSMMIPRIYKTVHEYMELCRRFCANLNLSFSELEDTITRATNGLFTDCVNPILYQCAANCVHSLPNLIQLSTNLTELTTVCDYLDTYLRKLAPSAEFQEEINPAISNPAKAGRRHLNGPSLIKDIRSQVDQHIYTNLDGCVDNFLKQLDYNPLKSGGGESDGSYINGTAKPVPSRAIEKLTNWMTHVYNQLSKSSPTLAKISYMNVCKRVSKSLSEFMLSDNFEFSSACIQLLSTDVRACEQLVRSQHNPGKDREAFAEIFADLRQLVELLLREDWNLYISKLGQRMNNQYSRVCPTVALRVLEKLRDAEKKRTGFFTGMRKEERDRRKRMEEYITQIRDIIHT